MTFKKQLLSLQVYIHIFFVIGLFIFPWHITLPAIILSQIVYVGMCGTAFFHRTVSHKNQIHPLTEHALLLLSWLGAVSSALAWAGVHRKHHRYSDTKKDPHSPLWLGRFRAYWQLSNNDTDVIKYVPDLLKNPMYVFQHKYYFVVLLPMHLLGILALPLVWYWVFFIVPGFLMWFGGSVINVFCHDITGPKNVAFWGILNAGEGWHKNHHDDPMSPNFGHWTDWGGYIHKFIGIKK